VTGRLKETAVVRQQLGKQIATPGSLLANGKASGNCKVVALVKHRVIKTFEQNKGKNLHILNLVTK
jgi:hypothetical protein